MYPGTYTTHFEPALTLAVGDEVKLSCVTGFKCRGDVNVNERAWLGIAFGNDPAYEMSVDRIDEVVDRKNPGKFIDPPANLASWIAALPGVTLVAPAKAVQLGGLDATQLDLKTGDADLTIGPISGHDVSSISFGFPARGSARIVVLMVHGHWVMVAVQSIDDHAPLADSTAFMQPLVDSIVWQ